MGTTPKEEWLSKSHMGLRCMSFFQVGLWNHRVDIMNSFDDLMSSVHPRPLGHFEPDQFTYEHWRRRRSGWCDLRWCRLFPNGPYYLVEKVDKDKRDRQMDMFFATAGWRLFTCGCQLWTREMRTTCKDFRTSPTELDQAFVLPGLGVGGRRIFPIKRWNVTQVSVPSFGSSVEGFPLVEKARL